LAKILESEILFENSVSVSLKVFKELRTSWRISLSKNGAILRLPNFFNKKDTEQKIEWSKNWIAEQLKAKPQLRTGFIHRVFKTGDTIKIAGKRYILHFTFTKDATRLGAKVIEDEIRITSPELDEKSLIKSVALLLSKVSAKLAKNYIHKRVDDLNDQYFKQDIGKITFKYNTSNWGSCSTKSNINFSTRLLLAPLDVIDYVIIHELSHLIHMNHSDKFWSLVGTIMPEYKIHEKWLKLNSHLCDFKPSTA
jgi:predicted metal-dependent hydrolase